MGPATSPTATLPGHPCDEAAPTVRSPPPDLVHTLPSAGHDPFDVPGVRRVLRDAAHREVAANAYARLRGEGTSLPPWLFPSLLGGLTLLRVLCIAVLIAAGAGWFLDPSTWATGGSVVADHVTPLHRHPNPYGWRGGFQALVQMHVVTGVGLLLVCLVPLVARKGTRLHRLAGRIFVGLWCLHLVNGLVNSAHILLTRGFVAERYPSVAGQGFSLYLYVQFAFISALVVDFLAHGMAALHHKNRAPSRLVRAIMIALPASSTLLGAAMAGWAVRHLSGIDGAPGGGVATEYAVVYLLQVPAYVFLAAKNVAYWLRPEPRVWLQGWLTEHQRNLTFCVGVTLYTAFANLTLRFAPQLTAPVFAAIDVGFLAWLLTAERRLRRQVVGGRLALAVASHLQGYQRVAPVVAMPLRDAAWIARLVAAAPGGALDRASLRDLLARHRLAVRDAELDALFRALDHDADGRLDPGELAEFLARAFAVEPGGDEQLAYGFRRLDADGDGRISSDELQAAALARTTPCGELQGLARRVGERPGASLGFGTFLRAVDSRRGGIAPGAQ